MTNLLEETREAVTSSGHAVDQITFIGSHDGVYGMSWTEFEHLADVEYHSGYGAAEVATDLIIVFADGKRMWRSEYDGAEGWDYDPPVTVDYAGPHRPIERLVGDLWPTLNALHTEPADSPYRATKEQG